MGRVTWEAAKRDLQDIAQRAKEQDMSFEPGNGETRVVNHLTGGEKGSKIQRFDLIPARPLMTLATVYGYGCEKYAPRNWEKGYDWGLSYAALQRHLHAFWAGEDLDPDSGLPHLAHAAWHCLTLMEWAETHPELDDRPYVEDAGFMPVADDLLIPEIPQWGTRTEDEVPF